MSEAPEPSEWHLVKLKDLLSEPMINGRSVNTRDDGFPVLRLTAIQPGGIDVSEHKGGDWSRDQASPFLIKEGDFLVSRGNGSLDLVGRGALVRESSIDAAFPDTMIRIRVRSDVISTAYLSKIWDSPYVRSQIERSVRTTSGIFKVNQKTLGEIELRVPPLPHQSRISQVLERVDSLRTKRREAIGLLDDLVRSTFLDMFGAPDPTWSHTTVNDVAKKSKGSIRTGPFGSQLLREEFTDSGISVLGIDNAVTNEFAWQGRRFITDEKYKKLARYRVYPGDVLITIMGTCGRCAVVPDDIPIAINTKHLCCITLDQEKCLPEFLHSYFLMHPDARSYLRRTAKGAIMAGLNMSIIKDLPIVLPPVEAQRKFVNRVTSVRRVKSACLAHLAELDALFAALQHRAFRDEPWLASTAPIV
ncbi:restriction endonuclease subunit S [Streptomyces sp. MBT97]|uniref:restriction endonuclease subunit S n=1 Tax=Streptomyces sp. MBT97 TaxID=2800411 RepID=UPI00190A860A|nr:restriction endonuclease subunit S [Streptomyces sp. MBT97]MBK3631752.1 restriction endonuclease subunit S [Streptomyces sp. MBT97]